MVPYLELEAEEGQPAVALQPVALRRVAVVLAGTLKEAVVMALELVDKGVAVVAEWERVVVMAEELVVAVGVLLVEDSGEVMVVEVVTEVGLGVVMVGALVVV